MVGQTRNNVTNFQNIERPPLAVSRKFGMKGQYARYDTILWGPNIAAL